MIAAGVPPNQRAYSLLAFAWSKSWRWESNLIPSALRRDIIPLDERIEGVNDSNIKSADDVLIIRKESGSGGDVMDRIYDVTADLSERADKGEEMDQQGKRDIIDQIDDTSYTSDVPSRSIPTPLRNFNENSTLLNTDVVSGISDSVDIDIDIDIDDYENQTDSSDQIQEHSEKQDSKELYNDIENQSEQQQQTVYRRKSEFVNRTEDVLHRCLDAGLEPDVSLKRSILSVWCRDRTNYDDVRKEKNNREYISSPSSSSSSSSSFMKSSTSKAEDLLARISVVSAARILKKQGLLPQEEYIGITSKELSNLIIPWNTEEDEIDLLPHPSIYMQLANAWNDESSSVESSILESSSEESSSKESSSKESSSKESSSFGKFQVHGNAVRRASQFLERVNADLDSLMLSIRKNKENLYNDDSNDNIINKSSHKDIINNMNDNYNSYNNDDSFSNDNKYRKNKIDEGVKDEIDEKQNKSRIMDLIDMMEMDTKIFKEVDKEVVIPHQGKANGLYIGYNLLLAAHAIQSTGSGDCLEAEVCYSML